MLTVLEKKRENKRTYYYCLCKCGNKKWIRQDRLTNTSSCGCKSKDTQFKVKTDIKGKRFGRLVVLEETEKRYHNNGTVMWKCKCDCGNICYATRRDLVDSLVTSCGCYRTELNSIKGKSAIKILHNKTIVDNTNVPALKRAVKHKLLKSNTSGYTGVMWDKSREKWSAHIRFQGKVIYLGRYKNKEDAIKARQEAEDKYFKNFLENMDKNKG